MLSRCSLDVVDPHNHPVEFVIASAHHDLSYYLFFRLVFLSLAPAATLVEWLHLQVHLGCVPHHQLECLLIVHVPQVPHQPPVSVVSDVSKLPHSPHPPSIYYPGILLAHIAYLGSLLAPLKPLIAPPWPQVQGIVSVEPLPEVDPALQSNARDAVTPDPLPDRQNPLHAAVAHRLGLDPGQHQPKPVTLSVGALELLLQLAGQSGLEGVVDVSVVALLERLQQVGVDCVETGVEVGPQEQVHFRQTQEGTRGAAVAQQEGQVEKL